MKNKKLIYISIFCLLAINTSNYWEGRLGFFAFPVFFILSILFLRLVIELIIQIYYLFKSKFKDRNTFWKISLITFVLTLTFYIQNGDTNFDKFEGINLFTAERQGSANCLTVLNLKDNFTFTQRDVCLGISETKGQYHILNDTIYFDHVSLGRDIDNYYEFGIIKMFDKPKNKFIGEILLINNPRDSNINHSLLITKNAINKNKNP